MTTAVTLALTGQVQVYCQPSEACWPTQEEIEIFAESLTSGTIQLSFEDF